MGVEDLKNSAAPYTCPECDMKGKSYNNTRGILKCSTEDCDVFLYYPETTLETKKLRINRLEYKKCPFCSTRGIKINDVKNICTNPDCRVLKY